MKLEDLNEKWIEFGGIFDSSYEVKTWRDETETANIVYVLLNGKVFEFKEDPDDGYRSHCLTEEDVERPLNAKFTLEHAPIKLFARSIELKGSNYDHFDGIKLFKTPESEKHVAAFGTDNIDDYYPSYIAYIDVKELNK